MTRAEWDAAMQRWMHRNDVAGDLDTVFLLTTQTIAERWLSASPFPSFDEWLAYSPRMFIHGGLLHLHELAQDDVGMAREMQKMESAIQDFAMRWSIDNTDPTMTRPYYPGDTHAP